MKRLFSGIQPSGVIHLGNYIGALRQWVTLQKDFESFFCVVDLHALTTQPNTKTLHKNILATAKMLLAIGVDPKKSTLFVQSHIPAHTQLYWVLNTLTKMSELELMTQYKDKIRAHKAPLAGLFEYPVLMAADILLYKTDIVPVGEDQIQHLELARSLASRFNNLYGKTFTEPRALLETSGSRIMGLDEPTKKMSKSASSEYNYIALTDVPEVVARKIKRAVTDSGNTISHDPSKKPGIANLLDILSALSEQSISQLESHYKNLSYGQLKQDVADAIISFLAPIQKKYASLSDASVKKILSQGATKASKVATNTITKVYKEIGLYHLGN